MQSEETGDEQQSHAAIGGGGRDISDDFPLPPLGEGIPWVSSPSGNGGNGGDGGGGADGAERPPFSQHDHAGQGKHSPIPAPERAQVPTSEAQRTPVAAGERAATVDRRTRRKPGPAAAPLTAIEKAKQAPLRFYLVREGHKFVPVGRKRTKGAWRELPEMVAPAARGDGIPVVLDPSPYQVRLACLSALTLSPLS